MRGQCGKHPRLREDIWLVRQQSNLVLGQFGGDFARRQIKAFPPGDTLTDLLGELCPSLFFFGVGALAHERYLLDLPVLVQRAE